MAEKVMNNVSKSRELCEDVSKCIVETLTDLLRSITGKNQKDYPDYIKVAVDWWADAILSPQFESGSDDISCLISICNAKAEKTFSEKEIDCFKKTLAKQIIKAMKRMNCCLLMVDYGPNHALSVAGKKIGVNSKCGYPCKTTMEIDENKVIVSAGYQAPYETLWTK